MKLVINKCFGGFGLSPRAVARIAEIEGRPCYFFDRDLKKGLHAPLVPVTLEELEKQTSGLGLWCALDIPDSSSIPSQENWQEMSMDDRRASNQAWTDHTLESRYDSDKRGHPPLVKAVEELGEKASGRFANLQVYDIPDGTNYEIDEYDGNESIHEVHQSWG